MSIYFCNLLQKKDKEKAYLDFQKRISPDAESTSLSKGSSFIESNQEKLASKEKVKKTATRNLHLFAGQMC